MALPCRMDDEVRRDIPSALNELPGDSIDQWALDMEAEYQYPEKDTDFPFEDDEAAGASSGAVRVGNLIRHTILRDECRLNPTCVSCQASVNLMAAVSASCLENASCRRTPDGC